MKKIIKNNKKINKSEYVNKQWSHCVRRVGLMLCSLNSERSKLYMCCVLLDSCFNSSWSVLVSELSSVVGKRLCGVLKFTAPFTRGS